MSKEFLNSDKDSQASLYGSKLRVSSSDKDLQIIKARSVETSIQRTYKQLKNQPTIISFSPTPQHNSRNSAERWQHVSLKSYSSTYLTWTPLS